MILGDVIENMCLSSNIGITLIKDELDKSGAEITLAHATSILAIDDELYMNYEVTFATVANNNIVFYVRKREV